MKTTTFLTSALGVALLILAVPHLAIAQITTGAPSADGWKYFGHSLQKDVYAKGSGNYGYDTFFTDFVISNGSNLLIDDLEYSWLSGDTVVGVGGEFSLIQVEDSGWESISGSEINGLLPPPGNGQGPRLQAKFGTDEATWSHSTVAPSSGNGNSSSSSGGNSILIRISGYLSDTDWESGAGLVNVPEEANWNGVDSSFDPRVGRIIWNTDGEGVPISWEILLNISLMERMAPEGYTGPFPEGDNPTVMTVQNRSSAYTDALVPEPSATLLLGFGALALSFRRVRKSN